MDGRDLCLILNQKQPAAVVACVSKPVSDHRQAVADASQIRAVAPARFVRDIGSGKTYSALDIRVLMRKGDVRVNINMGVAHNKAKPPRKLRAI